MIRSIKEKPVTPCPCQDCICKAVCIPRVQYTPLKDRQALLPSFSTLINKCCILREYFGCPKPKDAFGINLYLDDRGDFSKKLSVFLKTMGKII